MDEKTVARFWSKVDIRSEDECWVWKTGRISTGYGEFSYNRRPILAHRFAVMLREPIDGLHVLHTCDNPPCCNPKHLRVGTNYDNVQDAVAKGRHVQHKLTDETARQIASTKGTAEPLAAIARRFGVGRTTIKLIRAGRAWKHATAPHDRVP